MNIRIIVIHYAIGEETFLFVTAQREMEGMSGGLRETRSRLCGPEHGPDFLSCIFSPFRQDWR